MNVSLVSMPFGPMFSPSIALGILKQIATKAGCNATVHYCNLEFAKLVGERFYGDLAAGTFPSQLLIGEWIFSAHLDSRHQAKNFRFIDEIVKPVFSNGKYEVVDGRTIHLNDFVDRLLKARELAKGFIETCVTQILDTSPVLVGFTSVFQQNVASLVLARELKARAPSLLIAFGGANCEGLMGRAILDGAPWVDFAVSGEGEKAFEYILSQLKNGRLPAPSRSIYVQKKYFRIPRSSEVQSLSEPVDLNDIPTPDHADYFNRIEAVGFNASSFEIEVPFETSRGCWWGEKHHCTFCGLNGQGMAFRSKSDERAFDELVEVTSKYPGKRIAVTDNILDMKYFRNFLPRLARADLDCNLFFEVKANLSMDQLKVLKSAGVTHIQPGIESLSDEVLGLMRKGVRAIQNIQLLRDCAEVGVTPEWNLIAGFPNEVRSEYDIVLEMMPSLFHLKPPSFVGQVRLDRFSPLFESADELGIVSPRYARAYEYVYPFGSDILQNLAYYFDFTYAKPIDVPAYLGSMQELTKRWKREYRSSKLISIDKGTLLLILDTRSCRKQPLVVLGGSEREVYLRCAKATNRATILSDLDSSHHSDVDNFLDEMLDKRLMVEIGGRVLALALSLEHYKLDSDGLGAVELAIRESALGQADDENIVLVRGSQFPIDSSVSTAT